MQTEQTDRTLDSSKQSIRFSNSLTQQHNDAINLASRHLISLSVTHNHIQSSSQLRLYHFNSFSRSLLFSLSAHKRRIQNVWSMKSRSSIQRVLARTSWRYKVLRDETRERIDDISERRHQRLILYKHEMMQSDIDVSTSSRQRSREAHIQTRSESRAVFHNFLVWQSLIQSTFTHDRRHIEVSRCEIVRWIDHLNKRRHERQDLSEREIARRSDIVV